MIKEGALVKLVRATNSTDELNIGAIGFFTRKAMDGSPRLFA